MRGWPTFSALVVTASLTGCSDPEAPDDSPAVPSPEPKVYEPRELVRADDDWSGANAGAPGGAGGREPVPPGCREVELLDDPSLEREGTWVESSALGYMVRLQDSELAHDGSWSAYLGGVKSESSRFYQTVDVPEGTVSLEASGWYSVFAAPEDPADVMIGELRSAENEPLGAVFLEANGQEGATPWLRFSRIFTALEFLPPDDRLRFSFASENDTAGSDAEFYLDDLSLVAVVCE